METGFLASLLIHEQLTVCVLSNTEEYEHLPPDIKNVNAQESTRDLHTLRSRRGAVKFNQTHWCVCVWRPCGVERSGITNTWISVGRSTIFADVSMQIKKYTTSGLHGAVSVCVNRVTHYWLFVFPHKPSFVKWVMWWGLVPGLYYLSGTAPVPTLHCCKTTSSRGRYSLRRSAAKHLPNTHGGRENTGVMERSLVPSLMASTPHGAQCFDEGFIRRSN